jgi:hypothetical protein
MRVNTRIGRRFDSPRRLNCDVSGHRAHVLRAPLDDLNIPGVPGNMDFDVPDINVPDVIDVPNVDVPNINLPNVNPGHVGRRVADGSAAFPERTEATRALHLSRAAYTALPGSS